MPVFRKFCYPADYDNVLTLWKNSGAGIGIGFSDEPGEIEKKYLHDPDLFLVAEKDGEIIGTVIGGFDGRRGMIYHLAVSPHSRTQGIGTHLMEEIEARLHDRGCRKVYLLVKIGNEYAADFYKKRGWQNMDHVQIFGKNLF